MNAKAFLTPFAGWVPSTAYLPCTSSSECGTFEERQIMKTIFVLTVLILTNFPVLANEILLSCNWGVVKNGVKVDLENSVVTLTSVNSGESTRYRASISSSLIEWSTGPGRVTRINRINGETCTYFSEHITKPWCGTCVKAEGF